MGESMKSEIALPVLFAFLFLIPLKTTAQSKYVPSANEVFYGTWLNEKMYPQKTVHKPDGSFEDYQHISDTSTSSLKFTIH
jgi:hypothetical protein